MSSRAERSLVRLSVAVAIFAVAARLHNIAAFPALHDFDASGHALNVVELFEGRLPNPRSWSGSQPPLYYALGAALWALLPERIPVHVMLRSISVVAWLAAVALVWRELRRIGSRVDAAVIAAVLLGVPGILIGSCMSTNDALCGLFVTATLVRLPNAPPTPRHAALTGVFAGLAALTKIPGLAAVGIAVAWYAWRLRGSISRAVRTVGAFGLVAALIAAPHYVRLLVVLPGSLFDIMTDMAGSLEKRVMVERVITTVSPETLRPWMWALLHAAIWGDPVAMFLPDQPGVRQLMFLLMAAGVLVTAVAVVGAVRLLAQRELAARFAAALAFAGLLAISLLRVAWIAPSLTVAKPTYMLPGVLPVGLVLALGVAATRGLWGATVRRILLVIAACGIGLVWYGWWTPAGRADPRVLDLAAGGPAVQTVERYFRYRADDPIRLLPLLDADVQLAHGLRLERILGLTVPAEHGLSPADARALEVARARLAWMDLYNLVGWLKPVASALNVRLVTAAQEADDARVSVRIGAAGTKPPAGVPPIVAWPFRPFEQDFTLRRGRDGWRITAIEQRDVSDDNAAPAFVAYPTLGGFERLRSLGWRPIWEPEAHQTT